jgi:hypothetical protein
MKYGWPDTLAGLTRGTVVLVFEGYKGENEEWSEHPIDELSVHYYEPAIDKRGEWIGPITPYGKADPDADISAEIGSMGGSRGWLVRVIGHYGDDRETEASTKAAALEEASKLIRKAIAERNEWHRIRRRHPTLRKAVARKKRKKNPTGYGFGRIDGSGMRVRVPYDRTLRSELKEWFVAHPHSWLTAREVYVRPGTYEKRGGTSPRCVVEALNNLVRLGVLLETTTAKGEKVYGLEDAFSHPTPSRTKRNARRHKNPRQMTTRELCSLGDKSARSELQRRGRNPRSGKRNPQSRGEAMEWVVVAPRSYIHALEGEMGKMLGRGHATAFSIRKDFIDPKDLSEAYAISPLGPPKPVFEVTLWGIPSGSSRASAKSAIRSRLEVYGIVLGPTRKRRS